MFATWLGPACLELHQITWNDPACLLEKIVTYEAVHPISNLYDLKRRLGTGRRCFGFFHPAMPGEPLVFIEVALTNNTENSIQKVLFDEAICEENQATTALLYSISSTQVPQHTQDTWKISATCHLFCSCMLRNNGMEEMGN